MKTIPFNRPTVTGRALDALQEALEGRRLCGDGPFTKRCHALLEEALRVPKVLLTTSCTHALEMSALLLNLQPGDEVIVPSFTFVSTVNAFVMHGAIPRFIDVRPDTLNMDETLLPEVVTTRTRAIVPVHYAGIGCNLDAIGRFARERGVAVVEDNAHGLFGKYRGRFLGTFGELATLSFHETKNISCGEGGALLISDPTMIERAEIVREKGTDRSRFFRGQVDKYTWVDLGSSFLPSDMLAALLLTQLENWPAIQTRRREIWHTYATRLAAWAREFNVQLPSIPPECEQAYHMFYMLLPSLEHRQRLMTHLRACNIHGAFHYPPLHLSPMGRRFGGKEGDCPVVESISDRLFRLPFYYDLTADDQERVIEALESARDVFAAGPARHAA